MCCQESGEREATVALFCPKAAYDEPKVRKVRFTRESILIKDTFKHKLSISCLLLVISLD